MTPRLHINVLPSDKESECVCVLKKYWWDYVVIGKDPIKQLEIALTSFLEYQKKTPFHDYYYNRGDFYGKEELTIKDVLWFVDIPGDTLSQEDIDVVEPALEFLECCFMALEISNVIFTWR